MKELEKKRPSVKSLSRSKDRQETSSNIVPRPPFKWLTRVTLPAFIFILLGLMLIYSMFDILTPIVQVQVSPVVEKQRMGSVRETAVVQAAGWIEADPFLTKVTSLVDGIVKEVTVLEGDKVNAGQVVARLDNANARLEHELSQTIASRSAALYFQAKAKLKAAKEDWENPVSLVRLLSVNRARLREAQELVAQLQAEISATEADADRLQDDHLRMSALLKKRLVSESDVIKTRTKAAAQNARTNVAYKRHKVAQVAVLRAKAELLAAKKNFRLRTNAKKELEEAEAAALLAKAELEGAKISIEKARLNLERHEIKTTVTGIVVERYKLTGSKVMLMSENKDSATIVSLYEPERLQVRVDIPLGDAGKVKLGQKAEISTDILGSQIHLGKVTRIFHLADIQKNTLQVKVAIASPSSLLRPEMLARVKFLASSKTSSDKKEGLSYVISASAVIKNVVFVVSKFDGTKGYAKKRNLKLGKRYSDGSIEVLSGLELGDLVIVNPEAIKPGMRVQVVANRLKGDK